MAYNERPLFAPIKIYGEPNRLDRNLAAEIDRFGIGQVGIPSIVGFFDDFNGDFTAAASGVSGWEENSTTGGSSNVAATILDATNGVVGFTTADNAGDNYHYQRATNTDVHETFAFATGKRAWIEAIFRTQDADQNLVIVGAHNANGDPWNSEPTDQAVFRTLSTDVDALQFAIGKTNSTEVTISLGNIEDATWYRAKAFYDGYDTVWAWLWSGRGANPTLVGSGSATVTSSTQGDRLPDEELAPSFGMEVVDASNDYFQLDALLIARDR